jgi:hypothetical protein
VAKGGGKGCFDREEEGVGMCLTATSAWEEGERGWEGGCVLCCCDSLFETGG